MESVIAPAIEKANKGLDLEAHEVEPVIGAMLSGSAEDDEIGAFLLALREKGEAISELVGAARAMRNHMTPIASSHSTLVDTCGTGGDGSGTFNISTAAAIVTAAAGVPVAKHGNRAITSKTGSADVLAELGVNIESGREKIENCLEQVGICFCFAPKLHPAMRHVGAIRRKLGVPTLFNLLGPLCNPAGATHQVLGTGRRDIQTRLAGALAQLGTQRSVVVRGEDGLDEVTLDGATQVLLVSDGQVQEQSWTAASFGLCPANTESMSVETPAQSAAMIRRVLDGEPGTPRDIVLANAATSIWLCGLRDSLPEATELAASAIDSGSSNSKLEELSKATTA